MRAALSLVACSLASSLPAQERALVPRFPLPETGLSLSRAVRPGAFYDVVGRRSGAFGYEPGGFEAWVYPLKLVDGFRLGFTIEGYPLEFAAAALATRIEVRPEATIFTHSHAAFTVRQIVFAPVEEPALVVLLEIDTALPMTVTVRFRPRLRLMWPAGSMTPNVSWDDDAGFYTLSEESKRFASVIGAPGARDRSVMPYQEEPRDVPQRFEVTVTPEAAAAGYLPILMVGGAASVDDAHASYRRAMSTLGDLYAKNVRYYRDLAARTTRVDTPDDRVDEANEWAKIGIDKGVVASPMLGTGFVAGYRTSGNSERPGFAWFFGRDALWTSFATTAYGDLETTRQALAFLATHQRDTGKIPHEVSQSAGVIPWFEDYPYPWNSADASPLYVIAHADYWRASGDTGFLQKHWSSIVDAFQWVAATDADGNGLVENTEFGHGWVESGELDPPHEELYQQGLFVEAARSLAELAAVQGDAELASSARAARERTRRASETTYWVESGGYYGYATKRPTGEPKEAEPGPNRDARQKRLDELASAEFFDEITVLPAVPMWWGLLEDARAQRHIDHLGGGALATDWGTRILSSGSRLYDPLSYHNGSVWPLFTGWASMAAYRYGRPHVGYQALMASALLTRPGSLGYVTELLSGDRNAPFGRSSHHQVWSEAMVVTPLIRGLLGIEVRDAGRTLRFAPQLPADWDRVDVERLRAGGDRYAIAVRVTDAALEIRASREGAASGGRLELAPALPLDAVVRGATVNGTEVAFTARRSGDRQYIEVVVEPVPNEVVLHLDRRRGSDVFVAQVTAEVGARSQGLRVLRSRADSDGLALTVEGLAGRAYTLGVRSPHRLQAPGAAGVKLSRGPAGQRLLELSFEGVAGQYVRRAVELSIEPAR